MSENLEAIHDYFTTVEPPSELALEDLLIESFHLYEMDSTNLILLATLSISLVATEMAGIQSLASKTVGLVAHLAYQTALNKKEIEEL